MSSSSSPDWQLSRLRRETVEDLRSWSKGLDAAYNKGSTKNGPREYGYTVDQLVRELLDRDLAHRERSRKAGLKRKDQRREARLRRLTARTELAVADGPEQADTAAEGG